MSKTLVRLATLVALSTGASALASHPVPPVNLRQQSSGSALAAGTMIPSGAAVELTADSGGATCTGSSYTLELEVVPVGQTYTGTVTHTSAVMAKPD